MRKPSYLLLFYIFLGKYYFLDHLTSICFTFLLRHIANAESEGLNFLSLPPIGEDPRNLERLITKVSRVVLYIHLPCSVKVTLVYVVRVKRPYVRMAYTRNHIMNSSEDSWNLFSSLLKRTE